MGRLLLTALAFAALVFVAVRLLGNRGLFVIRVGRGQVRLRGQVPGRRTGDVLEFIASLRLPAGALIRALPEDHRFRLVFRGVPAGLQQRIRNYLYLE